VIILHLLFQYPFLASENEKLQHWLSWKISNMVSGCYYSLPTYIG
jgi:hypothetical protein